MRIADGRFRPMRRRVRTLVQSLTAMVLCLGVTAAGHARAYVVAPNGLDTQDGSRRAPWATIGHALRHAGPGDTVYLRGGRYAELVRLPRSGHPRRGFITLRNYPGETPTIDGRDLDVPGGERGLITIADRSYIRIQGLTLTGFSSTDESVPMGLFVTGAGRHIQLVDNHIHGIETRLEGCDGNALGIAVYGRRAPEPLSQVLIRGNEVERLRTGCSESVALNGNVTDFEISHNVIHDNNNIGIDIIGHEGMAPIARYDLARNGVIRDNTVHHISSRDNSAYPEATMAAGGIYVDGGRDVVIERNRVFANDIGIELASEHAGQATRHVLVRNNLIYNNHVIGLALGGYDRDVGGAVDNRIVHNTFYHNDTAMSWGGEVVVQHNARDNVFEHNLVYANDQAVFINNYVDSTPQPLTSDANLFYTDRGNGAGAWQWRGAHHAGIEAYRRASGNDRRSLFADPRRVRRAHFQRVSRDDEAPSRRLRDGARAFGAPAFEYGALWRGPDAPPGADAVR